MFSGPSVTKGYKACDRVSHLITGCIGGTNFGCPPWRSCHFCQKITQWCEYGGSTLVHGPLWVRVLRLPPKTLSIGVNVRVNGWLSFYVSMNWLIVQGVSCPHPLSARIGSSAPRFRDKVVEDVSMSMRWMETATWLVEAGIRMRQEKDRKEWNLIIFTRVTQ